jgi:hypothetical protein
MKIVRFRWLLANRFARTVAEAQMAALRPHTDRFGGQRQQQTHRQLTG